MRKNLSLLAFFYILCTTAQTRPDSTWAKTTFLDPVILTAVGTRDSILKTPASVARLAASDLQRGDLSDMAAPLNRIPGVVMQTSNIATNRISLRGVGARTPYGTNKIRAFYGNIPLTTGDSETTIEDLDLSQIKQIEIIKGPLSSQYGAGLGGAILIEPMMAPGNGHTLSAQQTHGSFGLEKHSYSYAQQNDATALGVGFHRLYTDGWRENSRYRRESLNLSAKLFRNRRFQLSAIGVYTNLRAYIPSSIDKNTFEQHPEKAAATWAAAQGYKAYESVLGGLTLDGNLSDNIRQATSVFASYKDNYEPRPFDILGQYTFAYGARTQFIGTQKLFQKPLRWYAGAEYFADQYHAFTAQNLYRNNQGNGSLEGYRLTALQQLRQSGNIFAQAQWQWHPQWRLQTGVSANKTWMNLEDRYPKPNATHDGYEPQISPQIALSFDATARQSVYVSVSRGFSLPSIEETRRANGSINTSLKPERGLHYELGYKALWLDGKLHTELALFHMDISNLLVANRIAEDQYEGRNAGKTRHQGVEIATAGHFQISDEIALKPTISAALGRYAFVSFENRGVDYSGNKLTGVPAHTGSAQLECAARSGWFVFTSWQWIDRMPLDDGNTAFTHAYALWNAKAGWRVKLLSFADAVLGAGCNNIRNQKYAALILPNALPAGNNPARSYYPGLPQNWYTDVRISISL